MNEIKLFIPGVPATITAQQKGITKGGLHYTKNAVAAEGRRIRRFAKLQRPEKPFDGCVETEVLFVMPLTQAQAHKYAAKLSDPFFVIRKPTAPDWDNWPKLLCDALTKEGFWHDDCQITDGHCFKRYGSEPRIEVIIRELPQELP